MFENVDGRTNGRRTPASLICKLTAHLGAFGSGELNMKQVIERIINKVNILVISSIVFKLATLHWIHR